MFKTPPIRLYTFRSIFFPIWFVPHLHLMVFVPIKKINKIKNKKLVFVEATTTYMKMAGWFVLGYLIKILLFIENWGSNA